MSIANKINENILWENKLQRDGRSLKDEKRTLEYTLFLNTIIYFSVYTSGIITTYNFTLFESNEKA